jgi:ABC-type cobalamin/Fe3+-siderophores transport system ATPase subunit
MAMIEIKNLTVSRGEKKVITNFNAVIPAATIAVITGPNGCGKSTLLATIAGDVSPDSGEITLDGQSLSSLSLAQQSTMRSVLSQQSNYWLAYTVRQSLELGQSSDAIARIDSVLTQLGIFDIADQSILTLSGGQGQRVEIARALIADRPILLLDEPLAAQDIASCKNVIGILQELKRAGKTILLVAHAQSADLGWCDQIINDLA